MMWKERMDICGETKHSKRLAWLGDQQEESQTEFNKSGWSGEVWQGKVAGPRNAL